jgi:hypothetical protein
MDNWCWMVTSSLQAAYPQSSTCTTTFYGRDLPAYRQVSRIVSPSPFLFFLVYISTLICVQNDAHILLNDRIVAWTPSCGASHDLTQRQGAYCIWTHPLIFLHLSKSCAGLVAAILSHRGHPTQRFTPSWTARFSSAQSTFDGYSSTTNVTFFQATKYFEYQSRYSYFWFQQVKMPGQYTRLLSATGPDHLMKVLVAMTLLTQFFFWYCLRDCVAVLRLVIIFHHCPSYCVMKEVPTHVAPPHDMSKVILPQYGCWKYSFQKELSVLYNSNAVQDSYVALNKPTSVDHWLKNAKASRCRIHVVILCNMRLFAQGVGDIVVLLDPDCAMIAPMNMCVSYI